MSENLKKYFEEISNALLTYEKPSKYFDEHINDEIFNEYPLSQIKKLKEIEQSPIYHKEGNVYNHTMLTIDMGATKREEVKDKKAFMWGLLLHDIGKITTTRKRKGKITAYNHDKEGEPMAIDFLKAFSFLDDSFIEDVAKIVKWHMEVLYTAKNISNVSKLDELVKEIDPSLIAIVGYCDRMGRVDIDTDEVDESVEIFLEKARNIK